MQVQYESLSSIQLKHDYFPDGNCPAVSLIPTLETGRTMQKLGIRIGAKKIGAELFYNKGTMPQGQLLQTDAPVRLTFILRTEDSLFLNYTDLPPSMDSDSIRYLTNLRPQPDQPAEAFKVNNGELLPIVPSSFTIGVTPGERLSLIDELGNELCVFTGEEDAEDPSHVIKITKEDLSEIVVNLSGEPEGLYTLKEGGKILKQFINAPQNLQAGDVCLLSVYLGDTGAAGKHILIDGAVEPVDFNLTFLVRETKWRYHLIDNGNAGYTNYQLLDAETRQPLAPPADPPVTKQMPDGSTAVVLTSKGKIPLRQRPGARFLLSMEKGGPERTTPIILNLPSADASRISRDNPPPPGTSEDPAFYSDMYVYL